MSNSNQRGTTTYVIYGSHPEELQQATEYQTELNLEMPGAVIILDDHSTDARALLSFYSITETRTPQLLIVSEDDTLHYHWATSLPAISEILYRLRQIGD